MADVLPEILRFERLDEGRFRFGSIDAEGRDVVFGGQLLAQMIVASSQLALGKEVQTIHAVFARAASITHPIDIEVAAAQAGRTFASDTVTVMQGDRLCARAQVLLHAPDADVMRASTSMPDEPPPEAGVAAARMVFPGAEMRVVRGTGDSSPGPAELALWMRHLEVPAGDVATSQAVLAWATNGLLIGTAMRPHGLDLSEAHRTLSTGVISHTLTFHDRFEVSDWLLLTHDVPFAGRGRVYGRGQVFNRAGQLVASFVQDSMVRGVAEGTTLEHRTAM